LEGDELDAAFDASEPRDPQQHFHVVNRSHAIQTEMILFDGGWLSVRQHKRSKPGEAQMINLRFVDPSPDVSRYFARRTLILSAALGVAGAVAAALAVYSVLIVVTIPAAILLLTGSAVAFATCAYRTRKDVVFVTRHGRAPVIELMATLGSFRTLRAIVPRLVDEIKKASDAGESDTQAHLRSEMREHYRLRECGVLNQSECAASTQRILQHFE
ncbi:MAG: hypothetical protein PVF50_10750, partial [Gammaproteobacteria bacterium]|jgi:hypothetical protein